MIEDQTVMKILIEKSIAVGKILQSPQTGFLHYFQESSIHESSQTIPVYENLLFILALFRSHKVEYVQEGKELLRKILYFQNKENGAFPLYLHQYPETVDMAYGIRLLAPFYWILKDYGHILGLDIKNKVSESVSGVLKYSLEQSTHNKVSYSLNVQLSSALLALGRLFNFPEWIQEGETALSLLVQHQTDAFSSTYLIGEILISLQMIYPSIGKSPWKNLWAFMGSTWNPELSLYCGPNFREWQKEREPKMNLFDLLASFYSNHLSKRFLKLDYSHLEGILIHSTDDTIEISSQFEKGEIKGKEWEIVKGRESTLTLLKKTVNHPPSFDSTYTPFSFVWKEGEFLYSFVCQGGRYQRVSWKREGNKFVVLFLIPEDANSEKEEKKHDLNFYLSLHPDLRLTFKGVATNTFELGQELEFSAGNRKFTFRFDCLEGENQFFGHFNRGNRPSQTANKGEKRFEAYDASLFLRSLGRKENSLIQFTFETQIY